ncbi:MAG: membrane dipeptidase [Chloroflexota bacterium]
MTDFTGVPWPELHEQSLVVDLHAHLSFPAALFGFRLFRRHRPGLPTLSPLSVRTDFPKLERGGVDVVLSSVNVPEIPLIEYAPGGKLWRFMAELLQPKVFRPPYCQASVNMMETVEQQTGRYKGGRPVRIARSVQELKAALAQGPPKPITLIHTLEGAHALLGDEGGKGTYPQLAADSPVAREMLTHLQEFYDRGVALITVAHFFPNGVAAGCYPFPEPFLPGIRWRKALREHDLTLGLTEAGEMIIQRMLELGILIDVTHCTPAARARIYQLAEGCQRPAVVATHVGAYTINPSPYNLQDWEIKWIAEHGGVVGVIFMNYWLGAHHQTKLGIHYVVRTLEHFIQAAGTEGVAAFGSDFDGFTDPPDDLADAAELPWLTQHLLALYQDSGKRRFGDGAIKGILGGNALRVLQEGWGKQWAVT